MITKPYFTEVNTLSSDDYHSFFNLKPAFIENFLITKATNFVWKLI